MRANDSLPTPNGEFRLAVVGSRSFPVRERDAFAVFGAKLRELASRGFASERVTIITGGARGIDKCAERWFRKAGCSVVVFPAQWHEHGRAAGPIRNERIVAEADEMLALWDGSSPGTKNAISLAHKRGIRVEVVTPDLAGNYASRR